MPLFTTHTTSLSPDPLHQYYTTIIETYREIAGISIDLSSDHLELFQIIINKTLGDGEYSLLFAIFCGVKLYFLVIKPMGLCAPWANTIFSLLLSQNNRF